MPEKSVFILADVIVVNCGINIALQENEFSFVNLSFNII